MGRPSDESLWRELWKDMQCDDSDDSCWTWIGPKNTRSGLPAWHRTIDGFPINESPQSVVRRLCGYSSVKLSARHPDLCGNRLCINPEHKNVPLQNGHIPDVAISSFSIPSWLKWNVVEESFIAHRFVNHNTGCHEWVGTTQHRGFPRLNFVHHRREDGIRKIFFMTPWKISLVIAGISVPKTNTHVRWKCGNRLCVRSDHVISLSDKIRHDGERMWQNRGKWIVKDSSSPCGHSSESRFLLRKNLANNGTTLTSGRRARRSDDGTVVSYPHSSVVVQCDADGCNREFVIYLSHRRNVNICPDCHASGRNAKQILPDSLVNEIRKHASISGTPRRKIAAMFGISESMVERIIYGQTYRHLLNDVK